MGWLDDLREAIPKSRELTTKEVNFAKDVFEDSIPYEDIIVSNTLGIGNCPYTEIMDNPGPFTGDTFIIHMGDIGYLDCTSNLLMTHDDDPVKYTFIHELTHVWQGYNSSRWFFEKSLILQCNEKYFGGADPYEYEIDPDKKWDEYNVEQQAKIVEHWFVEGQKTDDIRYPYIRDNIRASG